MWFFLSPRRLCILDRPPTRNLPVGVARHAKIAGYFTLSIRSFRRGRNLVFLLSTPCCAGLPVSARRLSSSVPGWTSRYTTHVCVSIYARSVKIPVLFALVPLPTLLRTNSHELCNVGCPHHYSRSRVTHGQPSTRYLFYHIIVPCRDGSGSIQSPVYQLEVSMLNGSNPPRPPRPMKLDPSRAPSKALLVLADTPAIMPA